MHTYRCTMDDPCHSDSLKLTGKGFVPVDSCLSLLNCMRDVETTWRQCFQSHLARTVGDG